jgi:hypothetical protein
MSTKAQGLWLDSRCACFISFVQRCFLDIQPCQSSKIGAGPATGWQPNRIRHACAHATEMLQDLMSKQGSVCILHRLFISACWYVLMLISILPHAWQGLLLL